MAEEEFGAIRRYLTDRGVGFHYRDGGLYDHKYLEFRYTAAQLNVDCTLHYTEGNEILTNYAMTQDEFDVEYRDEIMKIANTANYYSKYGSMIVGDPKFGRGEEETFGVWTRLTNAGIQEPSPVVIDAMISNACRLMGDYYPALMKVAWGGMSAEEAVEFAFRDPDDSSTSPPNISGYE